uniref:MIP33516p1 n=1 Tax=Drosophila melanogaster TaxID=7227 RepID=H1UUB7_DROME|nr:MIP33516p1 [Drosophila melanogaster]AFE00725.1 MIP35106p1 [Drosophila melanogaster]
MKIDRYIPSESRPRPPTPPSKKLMHFPLPLAVSPKQLPATQAAPSRSSPSLL